MTLNLLFLLAKLAYCTKFNSENLERLLEADNSMGIYLEYEKAFCNASYFRTNIFERKSILTARGGDIYYHHPVSNTEVEVITAGKNILQEFSVRPFMACTVNTESFPAAFEQHTNMSQITLVSSFTHPLKRVGQDVYCRLKRSIELRFLLWKSMSSATMAPIASICQYSGSGKSKMSSELTKEGPGAMIILRNLRKEDGNPPGNNLFTHLTGIIKKCRKGFLI